APEYRVGVVEIQLARDQKRRDAPERRPDLVVHAARREGSGLQVKEARDRLEDGVDGLTPAREAEEGQKRRQGEQRAGNHPGLVRGLWHGSVASARAGS